jgi:16S rRNA (guanine966-N2)-methyltransferase
MRIIAGEFRSRKLKTVPGTAVRPTPDRLRETLFSILAPRLAGTVFLDAYAGSGAVGLEALSRGARRIILVERNPAALAVIRDNVQSLGVHSAATIVRGQASVQVPNHPAEIAFIDPPYDLENEYTTCLAALAQTAASLVIAQHTSRLVLAEEHGTLHKTRVVRQGDNSLSFFEPIFAS